MFFKEHINVKNIVFLVLVILALQFIAKIKLIALLFFAAYVLACSLNPLVDKLEKKMNRAMAASLVIMASLGVGFACFVPIIMVAVREVHGMGKVFPLKLAMLQTYMEGKNLWGHQLLEMINIGKIFDATTPVVTELFNRSVNITMGLATGVMVFLAICMILFYLLADKKAIKAYFLKLFPENIKHKADVISDNISQKVGGYIIAQVATMVAIGLITALGLMILRVEYPLLLGLITGVLDIVPVIGPTIALLICIVMAYHSGPWMILFVIVMFLVAQQLANNFVRPVVFGRFLDLHPLIIIFSLLVTAQFLGVWGVILAPALAAMVVVLFDELYIKTVNKSK